MADLLHELTMRGRIHTVARVLSAGHIGASSEDATLTNARAIVAAVERGTCSSVGDLVSWILADDSCTDLQTVSLRTLQKAYDAARPAVVAARPSALRLVSFDALSRARTTMADFTQFYLPLHGLKDRDFFRWLPILIFVEACIYQLDEDNEQLCREPDKMVRMGNESGERCSMSSATERGLYGVLRSRDLLSAEVERELAAGREYWTMERKLCAAMSEIRPVNLEVRMPFTRVRH